MQRNNKNNIKASVSRIVAYKVLYDVLVHKAYSNISLLNHLNSSIKNEADRRLASNIVYGVLKNKAFLEYVIKKLSKIKFEKIEDGVKIVLYIGLYQLLFLSKIPEYALVNDSVNLAKMYIGIRVASFVNSILRNAIKNKEEFKTIKFDEFEDEMLYKYNFNKDLVSVLSNNLDKEKLIEYANYVKEPPHINIRVNGLKITKNELIKKLKEYDLDIDTKDDSDILIIKSHINIASLKEFRDGLFVVQDQGASYIVKGLDLKENLTVMDMCAAPGAKSFQAADIMNNTGQIDSFDIYPKKIDLLTRSARMLNIKNLKAHKMDSSIYDIDLKEKYDRIICDVPCSGLGVIRRKPEIMIKFDKGNIQSLTEIQKEILSNGIKYLKKGGKLIYSTCTINKEENEDVVNYILENNNDIGLEEINLPFENQGMLNINPVLLNSDGFFMAKLIKK